MSQNADHLWDLVERCTQVCRTLPSNTQITGITALALLGIQIPQSIALHTFENVHVLLPLDSTRSYASGVVTHQTTRTVPPPVPIRGLPVSCPPEAWYWAAFELLKNVPFSSKLATPGTPVLLNTLDPEVVPQDWVIAHIRGRGTKPDATRTPIDRSRIVDAVCLADALMQRKHPILTHDDFITHLDSFPGSRGIRRLRAAFSHARSGTDSVPETILRLTVVEAGFSTPQPNIPVQTGSGMRYVDLGWIDAEIGLEYQGSYHYEAAGQGRADQQRRADLERAGWIIIEVVWEDLQRPYALAERIAAAFSHRLR